MKISINDIKRVAKKSKWTVYDEGNVINFIKSGVSNTCWFNIEIELYGVCGEDENYISMFIINKLRETLINFDNANNIYKIDYTDYEPKVEIVKEDVYYIKKRLEILCKKLSFLQWL